MGAGFIVTEMSQVLIRTLHVFSVTQPLVFVWSGKLLRGYVMRHPHQAYLNGHATDVVAEDPVENFVVLCSTEHSGGSVNGSRALGCGLRVGSDICDGDVVPLPLRVARVAAVGALASCSSGEPNVGVAILIEHAAVKVVVVASVGLRVGGLAQRDGGLEHWSLHVVNEDSEVTGLAVGQLARVAVVGCWEPGRRGGVLAVTAHSDVIGVGGATELVVSAVVAAIVFLAEVDELRPVLDLDSVVLAISQVGDGWGSCEVLVEGMVGLEANILSCVGGEDGHVVVVVSDELGSIDPPAGDTLLRVVELKVVPGVELDSERLADGLGAGLEAAEALGAAPTVLLGDDVTQGAHSARVGERAIVVAVAHVLSGGVDAHATVACPVVALLGSINTSIAESRASATDLLVVVLLDDEGEAITTTAKAGWVQNRVTSHAEARHLELEGGLETVVEVDLGGVVHGALSLVGVRGEAHDGLVVVICDHVRILVLADSEPLARGVGGAGLCVRAKEVGPVELGDDVQVVLGCTGLLWVAVVAADTDVPVVAVVRRKVGSASPGWAGDLLLWDGEGPGVGLAHALVVVGRGGWNSGLLDDEVDIVVRGLHEDTNLHVGVRRADLVVCEAIGVHDGGNLEPAAARLDLACILDVDLLVGVRGTSLAISSEARDRSRADEADLVNDTSSLAHVQPARLVVVVVVGVNTIMAVGGTLTSAGSTSSACTSILDESGLDLELGVGLDLGDDLVVLTDHHQIADRQLVLELGLGNIEGTFDDLGGSGAVDRDLTSALLARELVRGGRGDSRLGESLVDSHQPVGGDGCDGTGLHHRGDGVANLELLEEASVVVTIDNFGVLAVGDVAEARDVTDGVVNLGVAVAEGHGGGETSVAADRSNVLGLSSADASSASSTRDLA